MNPTPQPRDTRAEALLVTVVLIWAANYPLAKYGIAGIDIFVFNGIRFLVAALVILAVFLARSTWLPVARSDWKKFLWAGTVANVVYQVGFIIGLNLTTAGNSAILLSTSPLWTVVIYARMHREKIPRNVFTGMAVSLCGVAMIVVGGGEEVHLAGESILGDCICLVSAFLWAFNTNLQKPLLNRYSPTQVSLVMVAIGAIGLSLIAVPVTGSVPWQSVHWSYYAAAIISGAFSIGLGNVIWSFGVKRLGPGRTGNFSNLVPVFALAFSYAILQESFYIVQFIGAAVTILGVWYARR